MEEFCRQDVYMAVPESCGDDQTSAVSYRRTARDFDGVAWTNIRNLAFVYKDRAVLDCLFRG